MMQVSTLTLQRGCPNEVEELGRGKLVYSSLSQLVSSFARLHFNNVFVDFYYYISNYLKFIISFVG